MTGCGEVTARAGGNEPPAAAGGTLEEFFRTNPAAVLGFSGGVDSSYLLYAGLCCGATIKACFVKTAFQPEFELQDALLFTERLGAEIAIIDKNILRDARITLNTPDRCYHCKISIIETLRQYASLVNIPLIIDGTNASDDAADRPGMRALSEKGIRSPLLECGITKEDVRRLSRGAELPTWNKPAYSCLATRVSTGITITDELLQRVERAESALFKMGFRGFRVRVIAENCRGCVPPSITNAGDCKGDRTMSPMYDEAVKLQFPLTQINGAIDKRESIVKAIKPYFERVLLDMEGRAV